jgi:hypothetical protein
LVSIDCDRAAQRKGQLRAAVTASARGNGDQFREIEAERKRNSEAQVETELIQIQCDYLVEIEIERDVDGECRLVVNDLDCLVRNTECGLQQMLQLREAISDRTDLRQRVRAGSHGGRESTEKIETGLRKQLIQAHADQRHILIQHVGQTRSDVCQEVLGVGEGVAREFDRVDNTQRDQIDDLFLGIEQQIGRHLRRLIPIDAQQPEDLPLRIFVVLDLGVRNGATGAGCVDLEKNRVAVRVGQRREAVAC